MWLNLMLVNNSCITKVLESWHKQNNPLAHSVYIGRNVGSKITFFRQEPTGDWIFFIYEMENVVAKKYLKNFSFSAKHKKHGVFQNSYLHENIATFEGSQQSDSKY